MTPTSAPPVEPDLLPPSGGTASAPGGPVAADPGTIARLRLAAICLGLTLLVFTQSSGLEAADTKLDLVVTPWRFLRQAVVMWDPSAAAGQLQNQAYGYLFPMGPFFLVGHLMHLPGWVVQRGWESALVVAAFLGVVRLSRLLGMPGWWPRVAAGLAYALAPRMLMELGVISSELLPVVVAPWALIPLVRGAVAGSPRRAAARSGVALLFAGGINAAATLSVLPLPALWLLTRSRGPRRAALMRWWVLAVMLSTLWWVIPLVVLGRYSPPFLDWIESAAVTTRQTSLASSLRGAEHWQAYLGSGVWPTGFVYVAVGAVVLATAVVALLGVTGLVAGRVRHRKFLACCLATGLVLLTFGHVASAVMPLFGHQEQRSLDGALNAFRNVHKFDPLVRLPIAIGLGYCLINLWQWCRERSRAAARGTLTHSLPVLAGVAAIGLGLVAIAPALTGQVVPLTRDINDPSWWSAAGAWLGHQPGGGRALVMPGAGSPTYLWGSPRDDALQPVADGPWTVRDLTPLTQPGYVRLLDELQTRFAVGEADPTLAPVLARSGIRWVMVRNDLATGPSGATALQFVDQTLQNSPGFRQVGHFGADLTVAADPNRLVDLGASLAPGAITVYQNTAWSGMVSVASTAAVVHANGSADQLPELVAGGLGPQQPVEFDGPSPPAVTSGQRVLTDGVRRREFGFGGISSYSGTMTAGQVFRQQRAAHDYLPSPAPQLSTTRYLGIAGLTASSSGADVDALLNRSVANGPWSALDGNAFTAWRVGALHGGVGQWLQVDLAAPRTLSSVAVSFAGSGRSVPDRVRIDTSRGSRVTDVVPDQLPQTLALPPGATGFVRITLLHMADGSIGAAAGIGELAIPGVTPARTLQIPNSGVPDRMAFSVLTGERSPCLTVNGAAACDPAWQTAGDERNTLDRSFPLPQPATYRLGATVRLQPDAAAAALLDRGQPITALATSTQTTDPRQRAGAAVDGDPRTGWVAAVGERHPSLRLLWRHRARLRGLVLHPLTTAPAARPLEVVIGAGGRLFDLPVPASGRLHFPRTVRADRVTIEVRRYQARVNTDSGGGPPTFLPAGIGEVQLLGKGVPRQTLKPRLTVACHRGPVVAVDGIPVTLAVSALRSRAEAGLAVPATPCGSGRTPLLLPAGQQRLVMSATSLFRPQSLLLTAPGATVTGPTEAPALITHWGATSRTVRVSTTGPSLLVIHENANPGWRATLGSQRLAPVLVDGWQQGYELPAGAAGLVHLTYAPQRTVEIGLGLGALAAVVLLALAFARHRRDDPASLPPLRDARMGTGAGVAVLVTTLVLLGGVYGAAVSALLLVAAYRFLTRTATASAWLAGGALAVVTVAVTAGPASSSHPLADSSGVQLLCLVAVGALLAGCLLPRRQSPGVREAPEQRPLDEVPAASRDHRGAHRGREVQNPEVPGEVPVTQPAGDRDQQPEMP